jgi:hypothetical protein
MGKPKVRKQTSSKRKARGKIKFLRQIRLRKKDEMPKDTIPKAPVKTVLPTNGITFKVKMRKK